MDEMVIIALIGSIGALCVSILIHIKHSKCFCFDVDTRSPIKTSAETPLLG